jgi:hypothetical protein
VKAKNSRPPTPPEKEIKNKSNKQKQGREGKRKRKRKKKASKQTSESLYHCTCLDHEGPDEKSWQLCVHYYHSHAYI